MSSYIPAEDHAALVWMNQFSAGIAASPYTYLLAPADATAIASAVESYADALAIADDENTRTKITVAAKDDARVTAEQMCRRYAILVKANPGISDPDKISIGVRPNNSSREPVHVSNTSPILNVIAATPGAQTLRYADSMTPETGKKPFGSIQLQLFVAVADEATDNADIALYHGAYTKNPIAVAFDQADDGKVATYFARWIGRRGDVGPWSAPVSMRIAA